MINEAQRKHYEAAIYFVAGRREKGQGNTTATTYPVNRGDILLLVMLLEQELKAASPAVDVRRLEAIREKLGALVPDAPEMSKEEARQYRD